MSRFFIPPESIKGNIAVISGREAHHILNVMRLTREERITAFDGSGRLYQGKILDTSNKKVKVQIERVLEDKHPSGIEVALVQALPKKNKMDYIVEKVVELGVDTIIPVRTHRTIVRLDPPRKLARSRRWRRIALEAAKQCGRTKPPEVKDVASWPDVLSFLSGFDLKLLFCLDKKRQLLKDILRTPLEKDFLTGQVQNEPKRVALCVGPEGDFTQDEIRQARDAGCICVSLGANVLKSDTAAVSALAMVNYELKG